MELTAKRLTLRPYREEDWIAAHEYGADPEVSQYQAWGPNTEEQTRAFILWSIKENEEAPDSRTAYHIGGCTLRITNAEQREAMIGYTLSPRYWNQGFTTEAAAALLQVAFQQLGLHRVTSWATPENVASWRVMEKIGMRYEGREREATFFKGKWHDWVKYAILDHEWRGQGALTREP